jgi:hypothetical protein
MFTCTYLGKIKEGYSIWSRSLPPQVDKPTDLPSCGEENWPPTSDAAWRGGMKVGLKLLLGFFAFFFQGSQLTQYQAQLDLIKRCTNQYSGEKGRFRRAAL